uniref:Phosphopantetheine adenylyltransferase n=1 Tax=Candidatus Kentrum sp. MB TaxID=2138164 RepID=A0A450X566_9GAMM|nr:MAG: Phosphopantetheine adenylyltransferase [Candidatus Kentron sp. MB]VFK30677.1 MAG: Phosphopantetheine adenylyltransferase [Candidatus Kentron sp. MB]VFK75350.1 MAG: Phosphopantetheine adenylyltransferase [Candidatus Kentron sp. MB]
MKTKALYPGTFDPITNGHVDIVERAARLFDEVIVAIAINAAKSPFFPLEERIRLAQLVLAPIPNARVCEFKGILVDVARREGARVVLRGLRATADFEYEFQLANMNRKLDPEPDTIFMTAREDLTCLSSSLIRDIASLGGDISRFVHPAVKAALEEHLQRPEKRA